MLKIYRRFSLAFSASILIFSAIAFTSSNQFAALKLALNWWDPFAISHYRLSMLSKNDFIKEIRNSLDVGDISEAQSLVSVAQDHGHQLPDDLIERTSENSFQYSIRSAKDFLYGAVTGDVSTAASVSGAMASDFFVVGDVRDLYYEGQSYLEDGEYSNITIGFALFGLASSAPSYIPGTSTPALPLRIGASLFKTANKAQKLSKPLQVRVAKIATSMIDFGALKRGLQNSKMPSLKMPSFADFNDAAKTLNWNQLKNGDFSGTGKLITSLVPVDVSKARLNFNGSINMKIADELSGFVSNAAKISTTGGVSTSLRSLQYADDVSDLSKFSKLSQKFANKTSAVIKILGKGSIKLGKLIYLIVSILLSVSLWLIGCVRLVYTSIKTVRLIFIRKKTRVAHEAE